MPPLAIVPLLVATAAISIGRFVANRPEERLRQTGRLIFNPDFFQGAYKHQRYFEGWYYKFASNYVAGKMNSTTMDTASNDDIDASFSIAVVPGMFLGNSTTSTESHAFIFVTINGEKQHYFRFELDEFSYADAAKGEEYYIQVGDNHFSHKGVSLNLSPRTGDDATLTLNGKLTFANPSPWPVSLFHLGAMGPVGWMPGLECTHGVLSFDHEIYGSLTFMDKHGRGEMDTTTTVVTTISMDNGRGYTEKDFGRSFPSLWVWIQTNSFARHPGTSLFVSIARIPTPLGLEFPGFTAALWHDSTLIPFATWSGAKFEALTISKEEVRIVIKNSKRYGSHRVEITVDRIDVPEVLLYAPKNFSRMEPLVWEALRGTVHLRLLNVNEEVVLDEIGTNAGLEVHGDVDWLVDNMCGKKSANRFVCL